MDRNPTHKNELLERLRRIEQEKAEIEKDLGKYAEIFDKINDDRTGKKEHGTIDIDASYIIRKERRLPPATNYVKEYEEFKRRRAEKSKPLVSILKKSKSNLTQVPEVQQGAPRVWARMFVYNVKTKEVKQSLQDPWPGESTQKAEGVSSNVTNVLNVGYDDRKNGNVERSVPVENVGRVDDRYGFLVQELMELERTLESL